MPVLLRDHGIAYFSAPKCACTSVKLFFFEIENGRPFEKFTINGQPQHIHNAGYQVAAFQNIAKPDYKGLRRFIITREPVKRFLSAYSNRVVHHGVLDVHDVHGLPRRPDLATFIARLDEYRRVSADVRHHTRPMTDFYGHDPAWFTHIFDISELRAFRDTICRLTGARTDIPHAQSGGPKLSPDELTAGQTERIERFYEADAAFIERAASLARVTA